MAEPLTTTRVRAVAVGNRITLPATEEAFVAELERIVALGAQYFLPNQPNVLVLGEMLGLPAVFTGQRALLARRAATTRTAMAEMAAGLLPRIIRCRQMWPGISLPRALLLASTDALYRPLRRDALAAGGAVPYPSRRDDARPTGAPV